MSLRAVVAKQSSVIGRLLRREEQVPSSQRHDGTRRLLRPDKSIRDAIAKGKSAPRSDILTGISLRARREKQSPVSGSVPR